MAKKKQDAGPLEIQEIGTEVLDVAIIGTSPFIYNSVTVKQQRLLLLPKAQQTKASRAASLKSDPLAEYRSSTYRSRSGPTALTIPCKMFKRAIAQAAIDVGGNTSKSEVGRLLWVEGYETSMYGVTQLMMSVMRDAGINRTPRIRTRAIVAEPWLATFRVQFVSPNLNAKSVINLIGAAGIICGLGDSRPQRGFESFGQFRIANAADASLIRSLQGNAAREAQEAALREPEFWNTESQEMYEWFVDEVSRRGQEDLLSDEEIYDDEDVDEEAAA